ncbi:MAG: cytochrome P450 [Gammaproteobacteria bacterium]|nr:cytochrome P450 [Gammaproteobacteria bacterium]
MSTVDERLTDSATFRDDNFYALLAQMRRDHPVYWTTGRHGAHFWSVFKHADIKRVFHDAQLFSSEVDGIMPIMDEALKAANRDAFGPGEMLIAIDPPRHGKFRDLVCAPFMPNALVETTEVKADLIKKIFDQLPADGVIDLVDDLAAKIPMTIIADILGLPQERCADLLAWGKMALTASDPEYSGGDASATTAAGINGIRECVRQLAMPRRTCPYADALSTLATGKIDGTALTESEIVQNGTLMILAGFETTRNSFSGGLLALLEHPGQMELLRRDPKLIRRAVEEMVRWSNPVITLMRVATADTEIGGQAVQAGDRVVVWLASANRDEDVFPHADKFDVTRSPNPHLGFGFGPHTCLGGPLAKLELRIALEELLNRYEGFEVVGKPERTQANFVGGLKRFPIRLIGRKVSAVAAG